jgi:hypothetical protein
MNAKHIIAAAILAATGSAFAQNTEFVAADAGFQSAKSRAEVASELAHQPKNAASTAMQEYAYPMIKPSPYGKPDQRSAATAARNPSDLYYGA